MKIPNPFQLFSHGTQMTTQLTTWLKGTFVGADDFGNRYYKKPAKKSGREKRWVVYQGYPEPSKVPPVWHGWLHHTLDSPPTQCATKTHVWQKQSLPNATGTASAYKPAGHLNKGGKYATTTADYHAWNPN